MASADYKPIGGVESCALYATDAVAAILFSGRGCSVTLSDEPLVVELLDDASLYEEVVSVEEGGCRVEHHLKLVADRKNGEAWFDDSFVERVSAEGVVAVVRLCCGREILVGYSAHLAEEQPLRLDSLRLISESKPLDNPKVILSLKSIDTELSHEIVE